MENSEVNIFKERASKYIHLDNEIKKINDLLKKKKKERDNLQGYMLNFMNNHKIKDINTSNGKLKYSVVKTKKSFTKDTINKTLTSYFNNTDKAKEVTDILYKNREAVEKIELRRIINKKKEKK